MCLQRKLLNYYHIETVQYFTVGLIVIIIIIIIIHRQNRPV